MIWLLLFLSVFAQDPNPRQTLIEAGNEERSLLSQIQDLDLKLAALQEEREDLQDEYQQFKTQKEERAVLVANATKNLRRKKEELNQTLRALYKLHRRGLARIIFGAENPAEIRRRGAYLLSLIRLSTIKLNSYQEALNQQKQAQGALEQSNRDLSIANENILLKEQELNQQKEEKERFLANVRTKRQTALQLLSEINRSRKNLQEQIPYQSSAPKKQNFKSLYGKLPWPVQGRLIRRFGKQFDQMTQQTINHLGIDIEADFGTPVRAVSGGKVMLSQFIPAYGQTVAVQHGAYSTIYAHLNGIKVRKGQYVKQGTVVGYVGNTGLTDMTNRYILSFEIRYNRKAQDPIPWLRRR
ncbi:MAG: peptidoglycan DD-metalloendopeptidase family protein [Myxococcota bacterium]|nr:peptidoglycan DD-metalloendopeptidase family protein [Myxococcota bacterium]